MKKILWEEMRRPEIEELAKANAVVVIPVGSTEQHRNYLPANTDMNCCSAIAQRAAQSINEFAEKSFGNSRYGIGCPRSKRRGVGLNPYPPRKEELWPVN